MNEQFVFERYKSKRSAGAPVGVLQASQGRIHNPCLRMLRQLQDVENASQKIFLKHLDLVGTLEKGEHYGLTCFRGAFQVAVDEVRARSTLHAHERRKSEMRSDGSAPRIPADAALHHLGRLDDAARELRVEHHLEGKSLETIARR